MDTVVITGVSRGLGAEMFTQVRAGGHRLVGIGRRFTDAQHDLARAEPERVRLVAADLADPASLPGRDVLAQWLAGAGRTALIHNAAVVEPIGAVGAMSPEALATAVAVNLTAPMVLTNAFLGALPASTPATILFISSGAAGRPVEGWAAYGATKRGGEAFFEAVAAQLADRPQVRVASVNPGVMDTGMQGAIRAAAATDGWFPKRDYFLALHADGKLPDPSEVARRILREHLAAG